MGHYWGSTLFMKTTFIYSMRPALAIRRVVLREKAVIDSVGLRFKGHPSAVVYCARREAGWKPLQRSYFFG